MKSLIKKILYPSLGVASIVAPVAAVISCGNTVSSVKDGTVTISPSLSSSEVQKIMNDIKMGQYSAYSLDGVEYSIKSDEDYEKNTVELLKYINTFYPRIINPGDDTLRDTGKIVLTSFDQFKSITQTIKVNDNFIDIEMPKLPDGYFWEFSSDEIYMKVSPDGSKTSYWTKYLHNFRVPGDVTGSKGFTFKAKISSIYGLRVLDSQEQSFVVNI